jgi:hypothetical protein
MRGRGRLSRPYMHLSEPPVHELSARARRVLFLHHLTVQQKRSGCNFCPDD